MRPSDLYEELRAQLRATQREVTVLERRLSQKQAFPFGRDFFCSKDDVAAFLSAHPMEELGVFVDMCTLFTMMASPTLGAKEYADNKHSANRAQLTVLETSALAALTHRAPARIFSTTRGGTTLVAPPDGFGVMMGKYDLFDCGTHCERNEISKLLNQCVSSLERRMNAEHEGYALAAAML